MGIVNFFPWILHTCPNAVEPTPQSGEYDYFYMDACSILMPCLTHPEERPSAEIVFARIEKYLDKLLTIVQPKVCLFIAVDGAVPKAKRARWPRTGLGLSRAGGQFQQPCSSVAESSGINLGTEFTKQLSTALRSYFETRPAWKDVRVVISDSSVPGEGEHKIMSFIRSESGSFRAGTSHCIYGSDTDLILLSLMVPHPNMVVLREVPKCKESLKFVKIDVIKRQLFARMVPEKLGFRATEDGVLNDFVFLCSFVGNDFLPRIPSLDVENGALDTLVNLYKKEISMMNGYLTRNGEIEKKNFQRFVQSLAVNHESNRLSKKNGTKTKRKKSNAEEIAAYKEMYYTVKMGVKDEQGMIQVKQNMVKNYLQGLAWLLSYYVKGQCSDWCYLHDYAPFASDITN